MKYTVTLIMFASEHSDWRPSGWWSCLRRTPRALPAGFAPSRADTRPAASHCSGADAVARSQGHTKAWGIRYQRAGLRVELAKAASTGDLLPQIDTGAQIV